MGMGCDRLVCKVRSSIGTPVSIRGLDVFTPGKIDMVNGVAKLNPGKKLGALSPMPFDLTVKDIFGRDVGHMNHR